MAKILICDDNVEEGKVMAQAVHDIGSSCKIVRTPAEAFKEMQTSSYDVVIVDIQNLRTPGSYFRGDAYDWARRMKELQPQTPIWGVSGALHPDDKDEVRTYFDEAYDKWSHLFMAERLHKYPLENILREHGLL